MRDRQFRPCTTQSAVAGLAATVAPDKSVYSSNETVRVTAVVTSSGAPVANASVTFTFTKPSGAMVTQHTKTNSSGVTTTSYRISRREERGGWQLRADAAYSTSATSATSGFAVQ